MIFVNLPITDIARTRAFYTALGFTINEQFSDADSACVVISETIYLMVLNHAKYSQFTNLPIEDAAKSSSKLLALSLADRDAVDQMMTAVLANGGSETREPMDLGFMYNRAFADPDGHVWEPFWMDPAQVSGN